MSEYSINGYNDLMLSLLNESLSALKKHEDEINKLNVFPVPDGDTGTNMVHTVQSVLSEAAKVGNSSVKDLSQAIIYGSLMGARGNSGVILSQIIKGICEEIEKYDEISPQAIARALRNGSDVAYQAVKRPTEGTMLTVINDMATAAEKLSRNGTRPLDLISYVIEEGKKSVERTPFLLPVLREAGVVDAGGYGLVVIGQGLLSALKGERVNGGHGEILESANALSKTVIEENIEFAYCTEFILKSNGVDIKELESELDPLGGSILVVGIPTLTRIHIHTNDPGKVIQLSTAIGSISDVKINNIIEQSRARAEAIKVESEHEKESTRNNSRVGIVAVANGDGVKDILLNLGVDRIVSGGQSMNPSTADILRAVNDLASNDVLILPNNKNIILSAQQVELLTEKNTAVIPTKSIPEAFAALLAYETESSFEENVKAMTAAFTSVKTGEVTYAVRDDKNSGYEKNDFIGLYGGKIKTTGKDLITTTYDLVKDMLDGDDESLTILTGNQVSGGDIARLIRMIESDFPELELDIHRGGQPIYHFIIGIE